MSKRGMRKWALEGYRNPNPPEPPPLWARILWAIFFIAVCGLIAWNMYIGA